MKNLAIIPLVLAAILVFCSIGLYNSVKSAKIEVDSQYGQVENQIQRRADLIPNLVNTVKGYMQYEEKVLKEVTDARTRVMSAKTPEEMENCNPLYEEALMNLDKIEWMLDQLTFENTETQINFMNTYKGELENVKKRNNELRTE